MQVNHEFPTIQRTKQRFRLAQVSKTRIEEVMSLVGQVPEMQDLLDSAYEFVVKVVEESREADDEFRRRLERAERAKRPELFFGGMATREVTEEEDAEEGGEDMDMEGVCRCGWTLFEVPCIAMDNRR